MVNDPCPHCIEALQHPTQGGIYLASCRSCSARSLANSPMAHKAMTGDPLELQCAIDRIWEDDYASGRQAVWEWLERIKAWKAQQQ
jgi:hypothetical protein